MYTKYRVHLEKQVDYTSPLHMATDMEIHYVSQCYENEAIRVCAQTGEEYIWLLGVKEDGSIAVQGMSNLLKETT